jgi:hypothetical protein
LRAGRCADLGRCLWRNGFGIIFPELDGESGFEEARATLELIRSLDVRTVIPGHGAPFSEVGDALEKAFSRLDYLQADPLRNAHNGIKVLVKFLLLERGRIALADLPAMMGRFPCCASPMPASCRWRMRPWPTGAWRNCRRRGGGQRWRVPAGSLNAGLRGRGRGCCYHFRLVLLPALRLLESP